MELLSQQPTSALVGLLYVSSGHCASLLSNSPTNCLPDSTDEAYVAGTTLASTLTDPHYGPSVQLNEASWNRAMNFTGTLWDFYQNVDPARGQRLAEAQIGYCHVLTFESVLHGTLGNSHVFFWTHACWLWTHLMTRLPGFPFKDLPPGTTICDLGGGFGHVSMHIAKSCPQLRIVLQDQPGTIAAAKPYWEKGAPEVVHEGRVEFIEIDFIAEAPKQGCDYYFVSAQSIVQRLKVTGAHIPFWDR